MIKAQVKKLVVLFNSAIGYLLPITDHRTNTRSIPAACKLTEAEIIKGGYNGYKILTGENPYWMALFENGIRFPEIFFLHFSKCYLVGRGIILSADKKVILESTIFQREYLNKLLKNHLVIRSFFVRPKKHLENIIPLLDKLSNNYYHWTTESIARLAVLQKYRREELKNFRIVIAKDARSFVKESIVNLFKWPAENILEWGDDEYAQVDNCLLPGYSHIRNTETMMTNIYKPCVYSLLKELSLQNMPDDQDTPVNIIISRSNSIQRNLRDEEKIRSAFPEKEFAIVHTEEMSFVKQVKMFRHAKLIIATHGAGLVNLIYANNDPLVIEIFPSSRKIRDACLFYQVAREMRLNYHLVVKEAVNKQQDMVVDEELLEQLRSIIYSKAISY